MQHKDDSVVLSGERCVVGLLRGPNNLQLWMCLCNRSPVVEFSIDHALKLTPLGEPTRSFKGTVAVIRSVDNRLHIGETNEWLLEGDAYDGTMKTDYSYCAHYNIGVGQGWVEFLRR